MKKDEMREAISKNLDDDAKKGCLSDTEICFGHPWLDEYFRLAIKQAVDDVDCSLSSMQFDGVKMDVLAEKLGEDVADALDIVVGWMCGNVFTHYSSGAPIDDRGEMYEKSGS